MFFLKVTRKARRGRWFFLVQVCSALAIAADPAEKAGAGPGVKGDGEQGSLFYIF